LLLRDDEEIVRPRVPLSACLEGFFAPEEVQDFFSTATNSRTTAIKTTRLTSFPDYLVLHMRKFVLDDGWVPKKLDVFVDVPDEIDISSMRGMGLQPGEELLPETGEEPEEVGPSANEGIVAQLTDMGFPQLRCEKAVLNTSNAGVEEAMNWLLSHMDDPDIDFPISSGNKKLAPKQAYDEVHVETLISFGFPRDVAQKALKVTVSLIPSP
jgi:ubiquitin carboxyl-terminal hydrolase 5/13